MVSDDDYTPATRPPGYPGGDRIRFEREGAYEQNILGRSAEDIEQSIFRSTERNVHLIGRRIMAVSDTIGDLGSGTMHELILRLDNGSTIRITGVGLEVEVS
jgi:hypothetical protein